MNRRQLLLGGAALALAPGFARAEDIKPLKIGVLNDLSGVYSDDQGIGSVVAAQLAIDDYAKKLGLTVELVSADHQQKPDVGSAIARNWFDNENVDVIMDLPNSAVALAVLAVATAKNKAVIGSGAGSSVLTGPKCSPNFVHWTYDTYELGHVFGKAMTEAGGKTWYFITADYAFGKDLAANAAAAVEAAGGKVLGESRVPLGASDFSSFLLQAQASGLTAKQKLAPFVMNVTGIPAIGLEGAQGAFVATPFYWDFNDDTRAFAKRYQEKHPKKLMPNDMQAGMYSATAHLLKAYAQQKDAADGKGLVDAMKAMPTDDPLYGKGMIRADGRHMHPVYLMTAKTPAESTGPWDVFKMVSTVKAEDAFRPLDKGGCPFIKA
jgi:branched-chain amino acid transport system substrate-binding protein